MELFYPPASRPNRPAVAVGLSRLSPDALRIGKWAIMTMMAGKNRSWVILKWVPLTLLALVAVVGAWFGSTAGATPATSAAAVLRQIIDSTRAAGTAKLAYASTAVGSSPLLSNTIVGHGVVDFTTDQYLTISVQHSTELSSPGGGPSTLSPSVTTNEEVFYRGHDYQQMAGPRNSPPQWIKFPAPTETPPIVFGSFDQSAATQTLQTLSQPYTNLTVSRLGGQFVDGTDTTLYRVTVLPQRCAEGLAGVRKPVGISLWVDGVHRLVQVRATTSASFTVPKRIRGFGAASTLRFPSLLNGTMTTTSTLRIYDYGTEVQIGSPQPILHPSGSGYSTFSVVSACSRSGHGGK